MIISLAGRRVDAADAKESRFPVQNVELVRRRVREMLGRERATAVVSAAACGADLIALSEAGELGLRRRIVLPAPRERFRESSVIDRPGDWGPLYDRILDEVERTGGLVVAGVGSDNDAYFAANRAILDEAQRLGAEMGEKVRAAVVWDGKSRGPEDVTEHFATEARRRGIPVLELSTFAA